MTRCAAVCMAIMLAGCVRHSTPDNLAATLYSPEQTTGSISGSGPNGTENLSFSSHACAVQAGDTGFILAPTRAGPGRGRGGGTRLPPLLYSPGDRFNVAVFGGAEFSGDYVINHDGTAVLAYAGQIEVAGLTNTELATRIERAYVRAGLFTRDGVRLSVRPVLYAPVNVTVAGAVFNPGRQTIGGIKEGEKTEKLLTRSGDNPMERFMPSAFRAAGGIRPDADLSAIRVTRNGKTYALDWRGAMTGAPVDDMPLMEGDHVQVPEAGCFQSGLVRPSQITPPGIRVAYSNLTVPANSNSQSIQSYQFAGSVPYGSRLLQGIVQANCVGGNFATNAHRHVVLISRNPRTLQTEVIQRSVEELVRSADRDTLNPYLMPDDAIACYDSTVTEVRDVLGVLQAAILPLNTYRGAFPLAR